MRRIQCPCCGNFTIDGEDEVIVDYCEVCGWRYDLPAHEYPNMIIGYNGISLNEARSNYKLFKASKEEFLGTDRIRNPLPEELPENNI